MYVCKYVRNLFRHTYIHAELGHAECAYVLINVCMYASMYAMYLVCNMLSSFHIHKCIHVVCVYAREHADVHAFVYKICYSRLGQIARERESVCVCVCVCLRCDNV